MREYKVFFDQSGWRRLTVVDTTVLNNERLSLLQKNDRL